MSNDLYALTSPLCELGSFEETKGQIKTSGIVELNGCSDSQKLHMLYSLSDGFVNKVIVTFSEQKAREICEDYSFYDPGAKVYPARDLMFYQADIHGSLLTKDRLRCISSIIKNEPVTIVTTFDALMNHVVPVKKIADRLININTGDELDTGKLSRDLATLGYERNYQVESEGQFSMRGGIIDIFPLTGDNPVRIELWGDEVDSIRSFDVLTQRSLEKLNEISIFPATEITLDDDEKRAGIRKIEKDAKKLSDKFRKEFLTEEAFRIDETVRQFREQLLEFSGRDCNVDQYINYFYDEQVSFIDYFTGEDTLFVLDEPARLYELADNVRGEFSESMSNRLKKGYVLPGCVNILYKRSEIFSKLEGYKCLSLSALPVRKSVYRTKASHSVIAKPMNSYNNSFDALVSDLKRFKKNRYRVILITPSRTRAARLSEDLNDEGLNAYFTEDLSHPVNPGEIMLIYGRIRRGFEYPLLKFVVISESDIFNIEKKRKRIKKQFSGSGIKSFNELSVGDYVIHESHGLGVYRGIEQVTLENVTKDYMKISYRDGGNLFIPATALDAIQKYSSKEGSPPPKLNKLSGKEWENTKAKVKTAVDEIAGDLVRLYAARQEKKGYQYGRDTIWQTEFEETFPFEETEDQIAAIEATKRDMESTKIMDRLICGDVGYGKTEIAIRAAFKAVQEGKQVVYLVPTTILAQQHYNTFSQRMKDYPVKIELLCRFRTSAEQRKVVDDLKKGMVDIVIGTHRLLSKDVTYKDLGLLIIDEEQRFGVAHKEKIKKLKENVDVLTLTATPIPRTLHMSLIGIRDMSVLEEAPSDRLPIQTFVMEYNEELVREAINRELTRNGQVFYVYNRVNTIAEIASSIRGLVPGARVAYAHGQMNEQELEDIMYEFVNGDIDVLVSTTIIETGLDISNVNTMIIHDSDRLGLSQLYQLRGRVGRSNRTAYAFLMYRKDKLLKETAEKRLQAIRDFTELGSGFKIAMRDLEIRGAGNLLGKRQSGHMASVGYDLYCKMLNEAVREKKGEEVREDFEVSVELDVDAFIPDEYIVNEYQKLDIYKRIAGIESLSEKEDMTEELTDRFGALPGAVLNLLDIAYLRVLAKDVYIREIKAEREAVKLSIYEKADYDTAKIVDLISSYKGRLSLKPVAKPYFMYRMDKGMSKDSVLKELIGLISGMSPIRSDPHTET